MEIIRKRQLLNILQQRKMATDLLDEWTDVHRIDDKHIYILDINLLPGNIDMCFLNVNNNNNVCFYVFSAPAVFIQLLHDVGNVEEGWNVFVKLNNILYYNLRNKFFLFPILIGAINQSPVIYYLCFVVNLLSVKDIFIVGDFGLFDVDSILPHYTAKPSPDLKLPNLSPVWNTRIDLYFAANLLADFEFTLPDTVGAIINLLFSIVKSFNYLSLSDLLTLEYKPFEEFKREFEIIKAQHAILQEHPDPFAFLLMDNNVENGVQEEVQNEEISSQESDISNGSSIAVDNEEQLSDTDTEGEDNDSTTEGGDITDEETRKALDEDTVHTSDEEFIDDEEGSTTETEESSDTMDDDEDYVPEPRKLPEREAKKPENKKKFLISRLVNLDDGFSTEEESDEEIEPRPSKKAKHVEIQKPGSKLLELFGNLIPKQLDNLKEKSNRKK